HAISLPTDRGRRPAHRLAAVSRPAAAVEFGCGASICPCALPIGPQSLTAGGRTGVPPGCGGDALRDAARAGVAHANHDPAGWRRGREPVVALGRVGERVGLELEGVGRPREADIEIRAIGTGEVVAVPDAPAVVGAAAPVLLGEEDRIRGAVLERTRDT